MIVKIANEERERSLQQEKALKMLAADLKAGQEEILSILAKSGSSR